MKKHTIKEAAVLINVKYGTILNYIASGEITAFAERHGKRNRYLISDAEIERFKKANNY